MKNIHDNEPIANNSHKQIKVGLQYILLWDCIIKNQQTINSLLTLFHSFCFLIKREKFIPEPNSN